MPILVILLFILLSGCITPQKSVDPLIEQPIDLKRKHLPEQSLPDAAPKGRVPVMVSPVVPKKETLSRYGNRGSYHVNGKTYSVLPTSEGYKAKGTASWYGTKFHQRPTSSGELYNLYALTAAHKTLPLPSYVKVTNLNNQKSVVVKVNDRGPFHDNRLIDLSYGAAVKLGFEGQGTAPVAVEVVDTKGVGQKNEAGYYLQAGAFAMKNGAQSLHRKLLSLTTKPVSVEKYKDYFVVMLGPFTTQTESDKFLKKLEDNGISGAFSFLK